MSQAVESVDLNDLMLEEHANRYRKPPPPPPRDPSYTFEKKTSDEYPSKTRANPEMGSKLTNAITQDREKRARERVWHLGDGDYASATTRSKKITATGEVDKSGLTSESFREKYGSLKK